MLQILKKGRKGRVRNISKYLVYAPFGNTEPVNSMIRIPVDMNPDPQPWLEGQRETSLCNPMALKIDCNSEHVAHA